MNIPWWEGGEASAAKIVPSKGIEGAVLISVLFVWFVGVNYVFCRYVSLRFSCIN